MSKKMLSFVIPCYRSEQTISHVVEGIHNVLESEKDFTYEIILINDGSPDNTYEVIKELAKEDQRIIAVNLSKNFGQHSALMAGFSYVSGDYIVGMDDDGEHDCKKVFRLVEQLEKGYDYVCADFPETNRSTFKKFGSLVNNWMATNFVGKPKDAIFSSFYIMRRFVVNEIVKCENPFPYVGGMIVSITKKLSSVPIEHCSRISGKSSYRFRNSLSLWLNGFTAFSVKPLRIATYSGFIIAAIGFLFGFYTIIKKIMSPDILVGYSSTIATILFIGGMLMVTLGLVGEYVGRIYLSINKLPQYVVREIIRERKEEEC